MLKLIDNSLQSGLDALLSGKVKPVDLLGHLFMDCHYQDFYNLVLERLFMLGLERGVVVMPIALPKLVRSDARLNSDWLAEPSTGSTFFRTIDLGGQLSKGTIWNVLDALGMERSQWAFLYNYIGKGWLSKKAREHCRSIKAIDFEMTLHQELQEKYDNSMLIRLESTTDG